MLVRVKEYLSQCQIKFIELNLFERQPNNAHFVRSQQIATRVYVFVLIVAINLLSFYTLLSKEAYQITVMKPSEAQYKHLRDTHPDSLSCPCSNISIPYSEFIMIGANYHQLCSSDFVSWQWIDFNINAERFPFLYHLDYRRNAAFQFQLLATLCKWAKQTINSSLDVFLQTPFVGAQVVPKETFELEIDQIINEWQSGTTTRFLHTTELIRTTNHGNMLINSVFNAEFTMEQTTGLIRVKSRDFDGCSCFATQTCHTEMAIYDYRLGSNKTTSLFTVRNFFFGCSPLESLLMSTLECFYQGECIQILTDYIVQNVTSIFTPLDELQSQPNDPIQYILQNLMVTSWSNHVSFSSFYRSCSPASCTYEYYRSVTALFLVTTIIGIAGGLSLILSILTLIILRIYEETSDKGWIVTMKTFARSLWIVNQEHQIIKRFQFVLLYVMIFAVYAIAVANLQSKARQTPVTSISMYEALMSRYSSTLQCPCSQISVPYKSFLSMVPRFHPLCNSTFMSRNPSAYILPSTDFPSNDFLATGTGQLALLQSLCQFSADTLRSALLQLLSSSTVNTRLLSRSAFNQQIQKVTDEFQSNVPNEILSSLALIQETTSSNMIMTIHLTNWKFARKSPDRLQGLLHTIPIEYQQCNCGISTSCVEPSRGMFAGCYPLVALFKSTLECFYNQSCIYLSTVFPALDARDSSSSRFSINTTIESMFSQLMVDAYVINTSYEKYFLECAPKSCSFSYRTQRSTLEIITLLISLYSGLTIVSACIVTHGFKLRSHRQQRLIHAQ